MRKFIAVVTLIMLAMLGVMGAVAWAYNYYLLPMHDGGEEVQIVIERGTGPMAIGDMLETHGIVRSGKVLYYWMRHIGVSDKVQAGRFTFVRGEGAVNASEKLQRSEAIDITIWIKEGLTIEQAAGRVASETEIDSAEFVRLCLDSAFIASLGVNHYSLEGYLFPDTYRLPENPTAAAVIRRMVARFHEVYNTVDFCPKIREKYNAHQVITLASIVEKEATLASERGRIAGVFHNRLRKGWPLGADPTVRYIFRKFDGPLYVSELNSPSPYNTRRFTGLPPGPICSPGPGAIRAAARPDTTDYMFFVALWDGSGAHYFSRTNAEHDMMKFKVRRENLERIERARQE